MSTLDPAHQLFDVSTIVELETVVAPDSLWSLGTWFVIGAEVARIIFG